MSREKVSFEFPKESDTQKMASDFDNPVLILTYFTARSNFATSAFIWKHVTVMDTLEMIASYDLEFGLLCKLND